MPLNDDYAVPPLILDKPETVIHLGNVLEACSYVRQYSTESYRAGFELAYVWSHIEPECHTFLSTVAKLCTPDIAPDAVAELQQTANDALERIFELIQLPKNYATFVYYGPDEEQIADTH